MGDYPLLGLFWTMLWFFLFIAWINVLFSIFRDIYRSADLSGWGKAIWTLFVVVLPLLGVLVYLIARGGEMQQRALEDAAAREQAMAAYVRSVAASPGAATLSTADELAKLGQLRDSGVLTAEEFEAQKVALLR